MKVTIASIDALVRETLAACGADGPGAEAVLASMHYADRRGVATHGVGRLPLYVKKIKAGHLDPTDAVEPVMDSGAVALLDAHNGFGQIAATHAVRSAMEKARAFGVAAVGVRNGNNFGAAGYFGDMAARNGFAATIYANAAPAIAPTGGSRTIFGTNPICYAFPGTEELDPIVLDMAVTVVARGKVRLAAKNGQKIPKDWATGPDGQPTDDPNEALKGALLPIGGYKGYGLSMFVDLFAGLLTGSAHGGGVKALSELEEDSGNGHMFLLIDVDRFMSPQERSERLRAFRAAVKACGAEGAVLLPGERGYRRTVEQGRTVELSRKQIDEINASAECVGAVSRLETEDE